MMWNGKWKRFFDYDKYEHNYLMLKRFWDQPYNKPLYNNHEKDLAFADVQYGVFSGKIE